MSLFKKFLSGRSSSNAEIVQTPTPVNETLVQGFEWNVPADGMHWRRLQRILPELSAIGITNVWLPPGCKADNPNGNGYDIYDLYDLGEFEQKNTRRTKWGTKEELLDLAAKARELGVGLYWDAVLNHRMGGDRTETCTVVEVDKDDRTKETSGPYDTDAWLCYDFEGRGGKYSSMKYNAEHFMATDWDHTNGKKGVFKLIKSQGPSKQDTDKKMRNYLMFSELDYTHPEVAQDVKDWGVWITQELGLKGFRLDAIQHFSERFTSSWVHFVSHHAGSEEIFYVGEYWVYDVRDLVDWIKKTNYKLSLFDAPLLNNFSRISTTPCADLRKIFFGSLVSAIPTKAVTVVTNHDTQPGQTVHTPIEDFFKPLAYSLILLRQEGYPCAFWGDLYGTQGEHSEPPSCEHKLADLILARRLYAYGEQVDYFDKRNCIGWVRRGRWDRRFGVAVVMSNAGPGHKKMKVGAMHHGEVWTDVLGLSNAEVRIDQRGNGVFPCMARSVSIWVNKEAEGRERFPVNFNENVYD